MMRHVWPAGCIKPSKSASLQKPRDHCVSVLPCFQSNAWYIAESSVPYTWNSYLLDAVWRVSGAIETPFLYHPRYWILTVCDIVDLARMKTSRVQYADDQYALSQDNIWSGSAWVFCKRTCNFNGGANFSILGCFPLFLLHRERSQEDARSRAKKEITYKTKQVDSEVFRRFTSNEHTTFLGPINP